MRRLLQCAALATVLFGPVSAMAYPDLVGKGYTNCITCHYSPTGGGFVNSYGSASMETFFPDSSASGFVSKHREKASVTGFDDDGAPQLQWGFGADARVMFTTLPSAEEASAGFSFFPMLLEVGGVVSYGKLLAYGSVGPKPPEAGGIGYKVFSREHWLQYRFTDTFGLRAGRMVLPFGIRQPDHTAFTRTDLNLGYYGQSYAAEADYISERLAVSVAGFGGDFTEQPSQLRERGVAASVAVNFADRGSVGISGLYGSSDLVDRVAGALFTRMRLVQRSYVLAEVDLQQRKSPGLVARDNIATFARLGWWALEQLDLYVEHDWRIQESATDGSDDIAQTRYLVGSSWWLMPWVEIAPQVRVERFPATGWYTAGFLQLHLYY